MATVKKVATSAPTTGGLPMRSPVGLPLSAEGFDEPKLRPTLSFRQKPEPPKLPPKLEDVEKPLRPTSSFRNKPEPPRQIKFAEPPPAATNTDKEKQKQMQKTKSKMDMLSSLIRQEPVRGDTRGSSSDEDDEDDDLSAIDPEPAKPAQGTGGRIIIRPSLPPPAPPPGFDDLPPMPKVAIKPLKDSSPSPAGEEGNTLVHSGSSRVLIKPPPVLAKPAVPISTVPPVVPTTGPTSSDENAPENWTPMWSPEENRNYYYNKKTGASTWENPNIVVVRKTVAPPALARQPQRSDLERLVHKKLSEHGHVNTNNEEEEDGFGRSNTQRVSSGSGSSGRFSIRATLSRALGMKKTAAPPQHRQSDGSDPGTVFQQHHAMQIQGDHGMQVQGDHAMQMHGETPHATNIEEASVSSEEKQESGRAHGTMRATDKHLQVVAEVKTKSGRHTIVKGKKPKKKQDHDYEDDNHEPEPEPVPVQHFPTWHPQHVTNHVFAAYQQQQHFPPSPHGQQQVQQQPTYVLPQSFQSVQPQMYPVQQVNYAAPQQTFAVQPQMIQPQMMQPQMIQPQMMQPQAKKTEAYLQAIYDFIPNPENESEMALRRGDVIQLIAQSADGWWEGIHMTTRKQGLFPGSYVQYIS